MDSVDCLYSNPSLSWGAGFNVSFHYILDYQTLTQEGGRPNYCRHLDDSWYNRLDLNHHRWILHRD